MSNDVRNPVGCLSAVSQQHSALWGPSEALLAQAAGKLLAELPNDLARIIYLASIRDYNTGTYLHPELSRRYSVAEVDRVLSFHHQRIFQNLLETPVRAYAEQLILYISFSGAPRAEFIKTWKGLKAYNSAIPLQCDSLAAALFCWNVTSALGILEEAE